MAAEPGRSRSALAGLAGALALAFAPACDGAARSAGIPVRSAVLVTLDTARSDAFGPWQGPRGLTPAVDALAAEGVAYRWARAVAPITLPSHASMMTGLYPPRHTVRENNDSRLPASAETLAELARAQGVLTAAFVGAVVLDSIFGLDQGFGLYDAPSRDRGEGTFFYQTRPATEVVAAAEEWLAGLPDGAHYFLWVHLFDPHAPYEPAPEHLQAARGVPYLGEIAATDAAVGRLFDAVRERGDWEHSLVVLVADHGEGLGQHGEATHGAYVWDTTLRVPFVVRHPDGWRAGERSTETVSVVDVFPTIVEALGLELPGGIDGRSLYRRELPPERGVYFESYYGYLNYGWAPLAGWADRGGKYLHAAEPLLYDARSDPLERRNLLAGGARDVEPYRRALAAVAAAPVLEPEDVAADAELMAELRALGYASAGSAEGELPSPLDIEGRPDPHARVAEQIRYNEAIELFERGDLDGSIDLLTAILAENPEHLAAIQSRSQFLVRAKRFEEAIPALEDLLRRTPPRAPVLFSLARCYRRTGDEDRALLNLDGTLELEPGHEAALAMAVDILTGRGELERAAEYDRELRRVRERAVRGR